MNTLGVRMALVLVLSGMAFVANASTIHPGEVRITTGKVLAIDSGANALVMESPTGKGPLTVGVTMKEDAAIRKANKAVGLGALKVDEPVTLTYTQENSRLIGLEVTAR